MMKSLKGVLAAALVAWLATPDAVRAQIAGSEAGGEPTLLQIRVVEGEGAVHRAGRRAGQPLTVQVTDETGKPVAEAAVSFRLPEEGPTGVFPNGLKTDVVITGKDGRASAGGIRWNETPGSLEIRITASKGEIRAGTVTAQYIAGTEEADQVPGKTPGNGASRSKWIVIGAIVAGAAAGGLVWGLSGGNGSGSAPPPPQIGNPTIIVGRP
ncbi:MAG: hypothetical protein ACRD7E_17510 [Bryobacteraceae bacterium]